MTLNLSTIVKELQQDKGISEDLIITTIETAISKAYEKFYGTTENLVIRNNEDLVLSVFSKKQVVKDIDDDLFEITVDDAKKINEEAEEGDVMLVPCNPEEFGRIAIYSAKQIILQRLKELKKDNIYSEFSQKEGELIIGYIQRIRGDVIYVDLGNYEGILPKKNQIPGEQYQPGDKIKTIVEEVKKTKKGNISVALSRASADFIKRLFEIEIPEIYDNTIKINKIAREAGYRTKVAVSSMRDEIDPVGACVGQKGTRIINIIKELEGEKIDVIKWTIDSMHFIASALTPARVDRVVITDEANKKAVAIVADDQLSFAIGKKGLNIKLANQLTDWNIDVKTEKQAIELNLITDHLLAAEKLFKEEPEYTKIQDLNLSEDIKKVLIENSVNSIEEIIELSYDEIKSFKGMNEEMANILKKFIDEHFEVVIEEEEAEAEEFVNEAEADDGIVYYECPKCKGSIPEGVSSCPNCGVEISFEDEEDEKNKE